jgi:hypothetical protein
MSDNEKRPIELWRYSGILLIITGIIHTAFGIASGGGDLLAIVKDGFLNAVGEDLSRQLSFWFVAMGVFIILLGHVAHHYIKKDQRPLPRFVGYYLLAASVVGCMAVPGSGFWLFIPQALIIIFAKQNDGSTAKCPENKLPGS